MTSSLLLLLFVLAPLPQALARGANPPVTRETFFDAVTDEAYEALASIGQLPDDAQNDPLNITLAMQLSILSGSVANVAWLLTEFDDVRGLGLGLKFPPELRERALRTTNARTRDGDVVALWGLATAALDPKRAEKLADIFIFGAFGAPFVDRICTFEDPPVFDDEGVPDCNTPVILNFIRDRMIGAFEDTEDMQRVLSSDPNVTVFGFSGAELSKADVLVSSWPCAYCFESDFCIANATPCPYEDDDGFGPATAPSVAEMMAAMTDNTQGHDQAKAQASLVTVGKTQDDLEE